MILKHSRKQHAIGQGFFHSGVVAIEDNVFNYVYDCGSDYAEPINAAVTSYIDNLQQDFIDALFVSHLHFDHVSGLDRLLVSVRAKRVFLPYLSPHSRLLLVAAALDRDQLDLS